MEKFLTGQKDTDLLILSKLDDESLLKFCQTSRYARKLCQYQNLWLNRFIDKYGQENLKYKSIERTWKNFYLSLVVYWANAEDDMLGRVNEAMFNAAKNKDKDSVMFYISQGADKWNIGLEGAAVGGDRNLVDFFIYEKGAEDFNSPMIFAAEEDHIELADYFYQLGADPNYGLRTEAFKGDLDLVKYFVELGANNFHESLKVAKLRNHKNIINYLESIEK